MPPPTGDVPDLAYLEQRALELGLNVSETANRARLMMRTNPDLIRQLGVTTLTDLEKSLNAHQQDLKQTGDTALATGWSGEAATAFVPRHAGLMARVTEAGRAARDSATVLAGHADRFEGSQRVVVDATGATAAYLRMMPPGMPTGHA